MFIMPSKIPPCNYQRKTICGYHRRAVAAVKFSPGGNHLGSACEHSRRRGPTIGEAAVGRGLGSNAGMGIQEDRRERASGGPKRPRAGRG